MRVVIVGGGVTGLAVAYYLQRQSAAGRPVRVALVEAGAELGGKVTTLRRDGFVIEAGADSVLVQKPWAVELCRELGLGDRLMGLKSTVPASVLVRGRLVPFPAGMSLIVPTRLGPFLRSPLVSWPGKLRMGFDLALPGRRGSGDESIASFVRRRFGNEAVEALAEPLLAGIHVADPERLSLQATFPRFAEMERAHASLILGMRAARPPDPKPSNGVAKRPSPFVTLRGGMGELVEVLAGSLGTTEVRIGRRVERIERSAPPGPDATRFRVRFDDGSELPTDAVVLTTPAYVAADLVDGMSPALAAGLRAIRYVSTATVSLGFRRAEVAHPLEGPGFVIPRREKRLINACTFASSKFADRAPANAVLLRAFVGGTRNEALVDLDDAALVDLVRRELRDLLGITAAPIIRAVYRFPRGVPQYDVGHLDRVAALEAACDSDLYLVGSAYRGVGLPDCVFGAQQVAAGLAAQG
jgi:oxygen-dependent protoporphyrinogen oxidase